MPLNEMQQHEVLRQMAANARKQTPHIRPDEYRAAEARIRRLAEQGKRIDGAPASASIYGVGGGMTAAAVTVKKPGTMEELIAQLEEEAYGFNATAEDPGEPAKDVGEAAQEARGDGPREETTGRDRQRRIQDREGRADARGRAEAEKRKGPPPQPGEERIAQLEREILEYKALMRRAAEAIGRILEGYEGASD